MTHGRQQFAARFIVWAEPAVIVFALGVAVALIKGFAYTAEAGTWGGLSDCAAFLTALTGVLSLIVRRGGAWSAGWWGSLALIAGGTVGLLGWFTAALFLALPGLVALILFSAGNGIGAHPQRGPVVTWRRALDAAGLHAGLVLRTLAALLVIEIWKEVAAPHRRDGNLVEVGVAATLLALVGVIAAAHGAARHPEEPAWTRGWYQAGRSRRFGWLAARCFALFLALGGLIFLAPIDRADGAWVHAFFRSGGHSVTDLMREISDIGGRDLVVYLVPLVLILLSVFRRGREARFFAAVMFGTVGLELFFKTLFHRARPAFGGRVHWDSFPSGHTLAATLLAVSLLLILLPFCRRRWQQALLWAGAVFWPVIMGVSRVYLGRHYVTDVTAAVLLGIAWVLGCQALYIWSFRQVRTRNEVGGV